MQQFKIKNFERDHPGERYPEFVAIERSEVPAFTGGLGFLLQSVHDTTPLSGVDANSDAFDLSHAFESVRVTPQDDVLVSFDAIRSVYSIRRGDLRDFFSDIWYPISDDMFVFDRSLSWLIFVHHDGYVYAASKDQAI